MPDDHDEIRSASRALRDAAAALSRALGQTLTEAGTAASREIAEGLGEATRELDRAAAEIGRTAGKPHRTTKAERTRADLLVAARRVIAEHGYEGASVGDIAAAAGYTKGAVYANFGSKEELFLEIAREVAAETAALAEPPASTDLRASFAARPLDADDLARTLLVLELHVYALRHPEARPELVPLLAATHEAVTALVHRARSTDDADEPTRTERDIALGLAAVRLAATIIGPLLADPAEAAAAADRLMARLLDD